MENKVSVIVNFHNGESHLEKCITSILEQNYKNLEIILWDNFSNDGSSNIVNKFKDSRIKYFYNKIKEPLYKARNNALEVSKGDFIAFLDCDDWWDKDYLSSREHLFSDKDIDFFYCNANIYLEKKKKFKIYKDFTLPNGKIFNQLSKDYFVIISGIIFRKKIFLEYGNFNENFNIIGDYDFVMRISKYCNAHGINLPLLNYRLHEKNFSKLNSKMFFDEYKIWFNKNNSIENNTDFLNNIEFFKKKLNYLEIKYLLQTKKNFFLLKKILLNKNKKEKMKLLILFILPKIF